MVIRTDFFALKVGSLPKGFRFSYDRNAERVFSDEVRKFILDGKHRHVPDAYPDRNASTE